MSNVQTIAITEELEVKCIASVMGGDSVEKLQIRGGGLLVTYAGLIVR